MSVAYRAAAAPGEPRPERSSTTSIPAVARLAPLGYASGIAAGAAYLLATAIFVVAIVPLLPPLSASASVRAAFYATASESLVYRASSYLGQLQLLLLLPFFGALLGVLRREEGGEAPLAHTVFGAGIAFAVVSPLALMIEDHLLLGLAAAHADPTIAVAFDGLVPVSFALAGMAQALVLWGTTVVLRRRGRIGRGLAWSGVALAALSVAGTATLVRGAFFPVSHAAALLARVWLLALAIALRPRSA